MWWWLVACGPEEPAGEPTEQGEDTSPTGTTPTTVSPFTNKQLRALRDAVEDDLVDNNAYAAQVAIWYEGRIVFSEAFGTRTRDGAEPVATTTLFQIGSDTKLHTSLVALQLVEAGALSLDDTASSVTGFAYAADPTWDPTLHQLLSHQGGMYDYTPWDHAPADDELAARFDDVAANSWPLAPPGAMWNYANPNFALAGWMTEVAAGQPWADLVTERLHGPLGMTRTFARQDEALADGDVVGGYGIYDFVDPDLGDLFDQTTFTLGDATPEQLTDNGFTRPAGLVWSTAEDQAKLLGFVVDGDPAILADDLRTEATRVQVPLYPAFLAQGYGYGMFVLDGYAGPEGWVDDLYLTHGGNTLTFTSSNWIFPEQRLVVTATINAYGAVLDDLDQAVFDLHPLPAPVTTPPELFVEAPADALVGTYVDPMVGRLEITHDGTRLVAGFPDLAAAGLDGEVPLTFAFADTYTGTHGDLGPLDFTFVADDAGVYQWVRNRLFVGTRSDAPASAVRVDPVRVREEGRLRQALPSLALPRGVVGP